MSQAWVKVGKYWRETVQISYHTKRQRLRATVTSDLFHRLVRPMATTQTLGAFLNGLRIVPPHDSYKHKVFTLSPVGWSGLIHLDDNDLMPAIQKALEMPGFTEDSDRGTVMTGFARNAVLSVADDVIAAVKRGDIRHFFLVGGCDGAKSGRNYYSYSTKKYLMTA